jgi:hypothetical protein
VTAGLEYSPQVPGQRRQIHHVAVWITVDDRWLPPTATAARQYRTTGALHWHISNEGAACGRALCGRALCGRALCGRALGERGGRGVRRHRVLAGV